MTIQKMLCLMILLTAANAFCEDIKLNDPRIAYIGRFDWRDPAGPRFQWPGSEVDLAFTGTSIKIQVRDEKANFYTCVVDESPPTLIKSGVGDNQIVIAKDLPGSVHRIRFVRRTESLMGISQLRGLALSAGGELLSSSHRDRKIEIIGDSISCGYGNESSADEHFQPDKENAYMTYGAIASRSVSAEYSCVAWSGVKMWPEPTIRSIYDLALPTDPTSKWNFRQQIADAVVINLSTNDFYAGAPDKVKWTAAYEDFVHRVRRHYPKAMIYVTTSPMVTDRWPEGEKHRTLSLAYLKEVVNALNRGGDSEIKFLDFPEQDVAQDGIGADSHPTVRTNIRMAHILADALCSDLGWSDAPIESLTQSR